MPDPDPNTRRYRAMIADRTARGHELYGNRHLTAARGQLRRAASELADAHVYVALERERVRRTGRVTAGRLRAFDALLEQTRRVGEQLAAAAREICDPTVMFEDLRDERSAYGEHKFGEQYLDRDNLQEVLEELSDASIFLGLQADRLRHRGIYEPDVQAVLVAAEDAITALANDVMRLQAALAEPDTVGVGHDGDLAVCHALGCERTHAAGCIATDCPAHMPPDRRHGAFAVRGGQR